MINSSFVSSCSSSLLPVVSLPSTSAYWRIPVLWLSRPPSSIRPNLLPSVALLHPRALRVHSVLPAHRALMFPHVATQNAPLLTWQPNISLLLLWPRRITIIPLRGQRRRHSRWISCHFRPIYFIMKLIGWKLHFHVPFWFPPPPAVCAETVCQRVFQEEYKGQSRPPLLLVSWLQQTSSCSSFSSS